jgi:hypothetical protein
VDLCIHSLIRLHGVVLNLLSTGTTLPFTSVPLSSFNYFFRGLFYDAFSTADYLMSNGRKTDES